MERVAEGDITSPASETPAEAARAQASEGITIGVDTLVWLAVIVAGGAVRFAGLGDADLTLGESRRAVDALAVAQGDVPDTWMGDLASAAVSYLFGWFDESVLLVRLPSAVGGSLLLVAVWLARPHLGRAGALTAGVLIAFSPLFVFFSRSGEPYGVGACFGVVAAVSLLSYLRSPGPGWLFSLAVSAGLATLTDAVAVSALLAVVLFAGVEGLVVGNRDVQRAWESFRASPLQWAIVLLVIAATLQLGLTHFGTSTEKTGFPGLVQFGEMFELPRDSRPPEYHAALLLAYDWPIVLAGTAGLAGLAWRAAREGLASLAPPERLLIVWAALAGVFLAFTAEREAGQALIALLPLALLGGSLVGTALRSGRWEAVVRWWPVAPAVLVPAFASALLMTQWSSGNASGFERALIFVFAAAALTIGVAAVAASRQALPAVAAAVAVIGITFAAHSSLAVAFEHGAELATDETLLDRQQHFKRTLDTLATEREGLVMIDPELRDELGWLLRDSPYLFGTALGEASVYVGLPDERPEGFTTVAGEFLVTERWYPEEVLKPRSMWRWLLYREAYGPVQTSSVQIYVPTV